MDAYLGKWCDDTVTRVPLRNCVCQGECLRTSATHQQSHQSRKHTTEDRYIDDVYQDCRGNSTAQAQEARAQGWPRS